MQGKKQTNKFNFVIDLIAIDYSDVFRRQRKGIWVSKY
jgi:hypothetical protein